MTSARHRPKRQPVRLPRAEYLIVLTLVFVALLVGWLCVKVVSQDRDLRNEQARGDALAQQVTDLGGTPVAGPSGAQGKPGETVIGARGPSGPAGPSGAPGKDGRNGSPGPSGAAGSPGPSGAPGADSTVPGPTGPAGADGASGAPGKDGSDGKSGAPPSSWTYTDENGVEYRCVPVDNFDPNNPRYSCTPTSTSSPSASPTSSPTDQPSPSDTPSSGLLTLTMPGPRLD